MKRFLLHYFQQVGNQLAKVLIVLIVSWTLPSTFTSQPNRKPRPQTHPIFWAVLKAPQFLHFSETSCLCISNWKKIAHFSCNIIIQVVRSLTRHGLTGLYYIGLTVYTNTPENSSTAQQQYRFFLQSSFWVLVEMLNQWTRLTAGTEYSVAGVVSDFISSSMVKKVLKEQDRAGPEECVRKKKGGRLLELIDSRCDY